MTDQLSFDPARTAVLSMDNQAGIVRSYATWRGVQAYSSGLAAWGCA
jgi:hypothetical protein